MEAALGPTLDELLDALSQLPELQLVGGRSNFHFKGRRFLHLHVTPDGVHADVFLGDVWEELPLDSPMDRLSLLALVVDHVERRSRRRASQPSGYSRSRGWQFT